MSCPSIEIANASAVYVVCIQYCVESRIKIRVNLASSEPRWRCSVYFAFNENFSGF